MKLKSKETDAGEQVRWVLLVSGIKVVLLTAAQIPGFRLRNREGVTTKSMRQHTIHPLESRLLAIEYPTADENHKPIEQKTNHRRCPAPSGSTKTLHRLHVRLKITTHI